jgi:3-phosphoshikimate 1-carboxyvinyltransferase
MSLPSESLVIRPFQHKARGQITLPGSKSITNRALLLAALCKKPVMLLGALFSEDTRIMAKALNDLGFTVSLNELDSTMQVTGQAIGRSNERKVNLFVGNAGTAARFLTAFCAAAPDGIYELDGVPQMHKRPMKGLIDALRTLGADIRCLKTEGFLPIEIRAKGLNGGTVSIDASESSQMLSALLMVAPMARKPCEIYRAKEVREPFVNMTLSMMRSFGFSTTPHSISDPIVMTPSVFARGRLASSGGTYAIEADTSSASYFLALPLVTKGRLTLLNMPFPSKDERENLQGDGPKFIQTIRDLGAKVERFHQPKRIFSLKNLFGSKIKNPPGLTVEYDQRSLTRGFGNREFREFSDTFLTIAAITPALRTSATIITGIAHTKLQETDRILAMATELKKILGDDSEMVKETPDSLRISSLKHRVLKRRINKEMAKLDGEPILIRTYNDHRVAMSFAILGCYDLLENGKPWLKIDDPNCCAKTFPNFFELLEKIRNDSDHAS